MDVTLEFLQKVKSYIEWVEVWRDEEIGECRNAQGLIRDGEMPDLYHEVLAQVEVKSRF